MSDGDLGISTGTGEDSHLDSLGESLAEAASRRGAADPAGCAIADDVGIARGGRQQIIRQRSRANGRLRRSHSHIAGQS